MKIEDIQKVKCKRKTRVSNSWGIFDAFRQIRREGWPLINQVIDYKLFSDVVSSVNKEMAELLLKGKLIRFPEKLGILEIRKREKFIRWEKGKLVTNMPIDWRSTVKLWQEDTEAYRNRNLVRFENDLYNIHYSKYNANYNNRIFYTFQPTRQIKRQLSRNIREGKTDALLLYRNKQN